MNVAGGPFFIRVLLAAALGTGFFSETIAVEILLKCNSRLAFLFAIFHPFSALSTL